MTASYDVAVAGLGAMGLSAAYALARRGLRVLGLDAQSVPNTRGSSHGGSRAFRMAYFEHAAYVPLLKRALLGWRELEAASQSELFTQCGGLYLGLQDSELVQGCLAAAGQHGLNCEQFDEAALRARWPQFGLFPGACAVYEREAGICRVEESLSALARLAREAGAELCESEPLLDWQPGPQGLRLVSSNGEYECDRLILSLGTYLPSLMRSNAFTITATRQYVGWFTPLLPERASADQFPVWAADFPDGQFWYGFAKLPGSPGLKLGRHQQGPAVDPLTEPRSLQSGEAEELVDFARRWLPQDAGALNASSVCLYENSPDSHFILDWHPQHPGSVLLAGGGSGHAFKFTPVLGELLADLCTKGSTDYDISLLSLTRFGSKNS